LKYYPADVTQEHSVKCTAIPLAEEELRVDKREIVTGRTRIRTVTDTTDHLISQELEGERIEVERIAIDVLVPEGADLPRIRVEGNVTILPVLEEVLVVEKRLRLREEVRITRHATRETTQTPITTRKQRAVVERLSSEGDIITDNPEGYP
jgi:uncharacterized protein (TIGR02271 family)